MLSYILLVYLLCFNFESNASRILAVVPMPSISHQIIFRPLTQELARRGHEVVVITTDPIYPKGSSPENFTEIDVKEATYKAKQLVFAETATGNTDDIYDQVASYFTIFRNFFEVQLKTREVQNLIKDKSQHFDLIIIEACFRPALVFSHIYKAPVIWVSSVGSFHMLNEVMGAAMHPILYPNIFHQRLYNLSMFEKAYEVYKHVLFGKIIKDQEKYDDAMLRREFGNDVPPIKKLFDNVQMLFLSVYHIWDDNRPVPPNYVYIGGIHTSEDKRTLPNDLTSYINSAENGVIYMSFGTNVMPSMLPQEVIQTFMRVFAQLDFKIILKWDSDELPGCPSNVKTYRYLPQVALLKHPKVKLFITQGGQQSTEEAIIAGVPLIGIPFMADQWFNVEKYVKHNIGLRLDVDSISEEKLMHAIKTVTGDESYRDNIKRLRAVMHDQPQTPLERAVWWTEHVLRHGGGRHLRAVGANMPWTEYLELQLVLTLLSMIVLGIIALVWLVKALVGFAKTNPKLKES